MKSLILLLALAVPLPARQVVTTYPMRNIPATDPRFSKVLAQINKLRDIAVSQGLRGAAIHIPQDSYSSRGLSLARTTLDKPALQIQVGKVPQAYQVTQTLSPGEFLVKHGGALVHVSAPGLAVADGALIAGDLTPTGGLHTYTTVLGASATVRSFLFHPVPVHLTPETFTQSLQAGETFIIEHQSPASVPCDACQGWGRTSGPKAGTPKQPCTTCKSTGKLRASNMILVVW